MRELEYFPGFNDLLIKFLSEYETIAEIDLSKSSFFILQHFLGQEFLSTYNLERLLKLVNYKTDYKNTHKKVKRLEDFRLIERIDSREYVAHGAVYYELTSYGLFYLLANADSHNLRTNYHDLIERMMSLHRSLFDIFVSHVISADTLIQLSDSKVLSIMLNHIVQIYKMLYNELVIIDEIRNTGSYIETYSMWNSLLPGFDSTTDHEKKEKIKVYWYPQIVKYLNQADQRIDSKFHSDLQIELGGFTNTKTIKFYIDNDEYVFKVDEKNNKALLLVDNCEIGSNDIIKVQQDYCLLKEKYSSIDDYCRAIGPIFSSLMFELDAKVGITVLNIFKSFNSKAYFIGNNLTLDFKYIAKDYTTKSIIDSVQEVCKEGYRNFLKHEKVL